MPSGYIWPAASGREVLRRVPLAEAEWRHPDLADIRPEVANGRWETVVYEAGLWCLKTSTLRRYPDADVAREALRVLARRKITLGNMLPKNTVLTLQSDGNGDFWLWSVAPWLATLQSEIDYATAHGDVDALLESLTVYTDALVSALKGAVRRDIHLNIHPTSFAHAGNQLYYVVDDLASEVEPNLALALVAPIEQLPVGKPELEIYLQLVVRCLRDELTETELDALALPSSLERLEPTTPAIKKARQRLLAEVA